TPFAFIMGGKEVLCKPFRPERVQFCGCLISSRDPVVEIGREEHNGIYVSRSRLVRNEATIDQESQGSNRSGHFEPAAETECQRPPSWLPGRIPTSTSGVYSLSFLGASSLGSAFAFSSFGLKSSFIGRRASLNLRSM